MAGRNSVVELEQAGIPVELASFDCGCWGKHVPPHIIKNAIILEVGRGYQSNKHLHGQNLYVLETDVENRVALIEMRKYGDLYGAGMWHYLVGVDGAPFVAQVPGNISTLADAMEYLKPAEVKRAEQAGADVKRQGDWYFVQASRAPRGESAHNVALDDDHVAQECVAMATASYVRGTVTHAEHETLVLETWHKALRNKAIRTGRLARGGGAD